MNIDEDLQTAWPAYDLWLDGKLTLVDCERLTNEDIANAQHVRDRHAQALERLRKRGAK